jgi:hypothetical protein
MKQKFYFFAILLSLVFFTNCSDDNSNSTSSPTEQKLVGKWYFSDPSVNGNNPNNSFTFTTDKKVTYRYWLGGSGTSYDSETGTFSANGDKLTMIFPKDAVVTFTQKVVFLTDKKVQFVATGNPSEEPYDGTYYKVD